MINKIKLVALLFFSLTFLPACLNKPDGGTSEIEKQFSTIVPVADMNQSLQMVVDSNETSFQVGSDIPLIIYNKSQNSIFFDVNSYVKLLIGIGNQWVEVKNALTYSGTLLLSPQGTPPLFDLTYTWAQPVITEDILNTANTDILLRIVIIGEIMEGETRTGKNVGAYVDVFLKP